MLIKSDALPQIPEMEQVRKNYRKTVRKWIEDAIIPVPISVSNVAFTTGHNMDAIFEMERLNLFQLSNDSILNPLIPFSSFHKLYNHAKSSKSNHPAFYHSRNNCQCGTPWEIRFCIKEDQNAILYGYSSVREIPIYYCKCQNPSCSKIFTYNGYDDGLVVLYLDSKDRKVIVPAIMMIRTANSIHDGSDTLDNKYDYFQRSYTAAMQTSNFKAWDELQTFQIFDGDATNETILRFMPRDAFSAAVKYVSERMMFPFLLSSMCKSCPNCGPNPRAICIDGIALGVKWGLFSSSDGRTYFNTPASQKPAPIGDNVIFVNKSLNESEYSFLQGSIRNMTIKYIAASQVSEKFKRGFYKNDEYTREWYLRLIDSLQVQSLTEDNARAVLFSIGCTDFLLDKQKPKLLNVEQSILGSTPGSIPMISSRHGGGFLSIAYAALALGIRSSSLVPKCFFEIWATETVDMAIAESILENNYKPPVIDEEFKSISSTFIMIVEKFLNIDCSTDIPKRPGINESSDQFCTRICRYVIKHALVNVKRQLHLNEPLRCSIREYLVSDLSSLPLLTPFAKTFPQLFDYLIDTRECPDTTCDKSVRPQFAYLSLMVANIWFREVRFNVHKVVNNRTQRGTPIAIVTLRELCEKILNNNLNDARCWGRDYRELLLEFVEQYRIPIKLGSESGRNTFEEDFISGSACFEPELENYRRRGMFHSVDLANNTNSSAAAEELLNNNNAPSQHKQRRDDDGVDDCKKSFPGDPNRSYGFFAIMCTCKYHCIYAIFLMDKGESCRMPHDAIFNRFKVAPLFIFYDNACHLKAYCITRNSIYFFKTTFLIDDLHGRNHIAICSCTHLRRPFNTNIEVANSNTNVCENFFFQFRRTAGSQVAEMNSLNAVIMTKLYGILYNSHQIEKLYS